MISRRTALLATGLTGLARPVFAQAPRGTNDPGVALVAADEQATSMQIASAIVARLGGDDNRIHAEAGHSVLDAAARLTDRTRAVASILPATTLVFMEASGLPSQVAYALRMIGRLDVLTFHVLASQRIKGLSQLSGQKVGLGPPGSPTQATASVLLDLAPVQVDPVYLDHDQALAAVLRGQIAAMMVLAPKPAPLFVGLKASDGVHFIPLPEPTQRQTGVEATRILPQTYPMLSEGGNGISRPVDSVAVPIVLGCFGWAPRNNQFMALARMADLLAERGSGLPGFDMTAPVAGWQRFLPVADWLAKGRTGSVADYAAAERRSPAPQPQPSAPNRPTAQPGSDRPTAQSGSDPKEKLFQDFLNWRRRR